MNKIAKNESFPYVYLLLMKSPLWKIYFFFNSLIREAFLTSDNEKRWTTMIITDNVATNNICSTQIPKTNIRNVWQSVWSDIILTYLYHYNYARGVFFLRDMRSQEIDSIKYSHINYWTRSRWSKRIEILFHSIVDI